MKRILIGAALLLLAGCSNEQAQQAKGFAWPKGDSENGKAVVVKYQCLSCHQIKGLDDADIEPLLTQRVLLGGRTTRLRTPGELVTAVVNPSHKIARLYPQAVVGEKGASNMKNFNSQMTVQELIDLTTFLEQSYRFTHFSGTADDYDPRNTN